MESLTSGVAVITFNGLKYLPQQLNSISSQTHAVKHIVISDDRSTDGTWEFLVGWAKRSAIRTTLIRNKTQLGLRANFEQAISAVEADIVFTSDQDDVWFPNKVELLMAAFEAHADVLLIHTDAILVDAEGRNMGKTLLGELELSEAERASIHAGDAFPVFCRRNVVTGATAAFRKSLLQSARPLSTNLFHDAWLALIASATGKVRLLEVPTIQYRQHGSNLVGVKKLGNLTKIRHLWWSMRGPSPLKATVRQFASARADLHARLSAHPAVPLRYLALATEALEVATRRGELPRNYLTRTVSVLRNVYAGSYRKFSYEPWSDALRDILNK